MLGDLCQRNTVVLIPVDDPADWEIPAMGVVTFTGTDGELVEIDTDDPEAARGYRRPRRQSDMETDPFFTPIEPPMQALR
ncbi:MAG: hypothetical protein ACUVT0_03040, partial [Thermochromatium sp.]